MLLYRSLKQGDSCYQRLLRSAVGVATHNRSKKGFNDSRGQKGTGANGVCFLLKGTARVQIPSQPAVLVIGPRRGTHWRPSLLIKENDTKTVQGLLRHANVSTPLGLYAQSVNSSMVEAQESMGHRILSSSGDSLPSLH